MKCLLAAVALVMAVGLGGCKSGDKFEGSLHARGGQLGDWDFEPEVCYSLEPSSEFGVELADFDDRYLVRFVDHIVEGPTLVPFPPGSNDPERYDPDQCDEFFVEIERTNFYVDDIQVLNGRMDLDCNTQEAGHFYGSVRFEGCH